MNRLSALLLLPLLLLPAPVAAGEPGEAVKEIAIVATLFAARSHGNAIASHFFIGFPVDGRRVPPRVRVVSLYIDQPSPEAVDPAGRGDWDVGARLARRHGATVYPTIAEALTRGGPTLAVDGVLYIGEHGDYPRSRFGVKMYPRLNHLEQIFRVFDAAGRAVPVFCDKHLSYSWLDSKWVYDRARELEVPFMAGSSLPLAWRQPPLEHPLEAPLEEAVAIGHGSLDSYGFHALEILQCMVERRAGGESGVAAVQALRGPAVYEAADAGRFSWPLVEAALEVIADRRHPVAELRERVSDPVAIIVDYRDGTRGTMLMLGRFVTGSWSYAALVGGETVAAEFVLSGQTAEGERLPIFSLPHFGALGRSIEEMFLDGRPRAPAERTLLTSGVLDFAFRSLAADGRRLETPELDIRYRVSDDGPARVGIPAPADRAQALWPSSADKAFLFWRPQLREAFLAEIAGDG